VTQSGRFKTSRGFGPSEAPTMPSFLHEIDEVRGAAIADAQAALEQG